MGHMYLFPILYTQSDSLLNQALLKRNVQEKKEEIWLSPMTKAPTPTEKKSKK